MCAAQKFQCVCLCVLFLNNEKKKCLLIDEKVNKANSKTFHVIFLLGISFCICYALYWYERWYVGKWFSFAVSIVHIFLIKSNHFTSFHSFIFFFLKSNQFLSLCFGMDFIKLELKSVFAAGCKFNIGEFATDFAPEAPLTGEDWRWTARNYKYVHQRHHQLPL